MESTDQVLSGPLPHTYKARQHAVLMMTKDREGMTRYFPNSDAKRDQVTLLTCLHTLRATSMERFSRLEETKTQALTRVLRRQAPKFSEPHPAPELSPPRPLGLRLLPHPKKSCGCVSPSVAEAKMQIYRQSSTKLGALP